MRAAQDEPLAALSDGPTPRGRSLIAQAARRHLRDPAVVRCALHCAGHRVEE